MNDGTSRWIAALLQAFLVALVGIAVVLLLGQALTPQPWRFAGLTVDRLSALMTVLVAGIGAVCYRFALRYLDGESGQLRFLGWLALTVIAAYTLMLATNLLVLFAAWALTSTGLHMLLIFYRDRAEAQRPARKKFLISRLGDLALVAAISLIWRTYGTIDLVELREQVAIVDTNLAATAIALLIVIAALTKSAQFPFHSWLPETMEAPTPVSALMHAGIINAGGVLLLRFAPLLVTVPAALLLLSLVGTVTLVIGLLAMWAQADIKRTLAWSTVSQMGFMMVQCGLAVFPAAALHILGHGCYKAWSFLRSGQLPARQPRPKLAPQQALGLGTLGVLVAIPCLSFAARITGFDPLHTPGELALTAMFALSLGQLWIGMVSLSQSPVGLFKQIGLALVATLAASVFAFALYHGVARFLAPALGDLAVAPGPLTWIASIVPVVAVASLVVVHACLPMLKKTAVGHALLIHALHGFYIGIIANRLVDRVWPPSPQPRGAAAEVGLVTVPDGVSR